MAIVVLIPGLLGRRLNDVRRRLDPEGQGRLPAHIPLVEPFRAQPSFLPLEQHCWQVCHDIVPFWVELGPLLVDQDEGLVYSEVTSGRDRLTALRQALLTGKYAPPRDQAPYTPRALIAQVERPDDLALAQWERAAAMTHVSFFLERINLMAQYPDGAWYQRDFYTLNRAVTTA